MLKANPILEIKATVSLKEGEVGKAEVKVGETVHQERQLSKT